MHGLSQPRESLRKVFVKIVSEILITSFEDHSRAAGANPSSPWPDVQSGSNLGPNRTSLRKPKPILSWSVREQAHQLFIGD
jgi:hypothetical protein